MSHALFTFFKERLKKMYEIGVKQEQRFEINETSRTLQINELFVEWNKEGSLFLTEKRNHPVCVVKSKVKEKKQWFVIEAIPEEPNRYRVMICNHMPDGDIHHIRKRLTPLAGWANSRGSEDGEAFDALANYMKDYLSTLNEYRMFDATGLLTVKRK